MAAVSLSTTSISFFRFLSTGGAMSVVRPESTVSQELFSVVGHDVGKEALNNLHVVVNLHKSLDH